MIYTRWIAVLILSLAWSALPADETTGPEPDPFPELEGIAPNVEFWVRAFSEWTLGQVAIHDLEYPAIVYEIADLPGPIGESYTQDQKDWIEDLRERWEDYLYFLERKVADDDTLDEIDKLWALWYIRGLACCSFSPIIHAPPCTCSRTGNPPSRDSRGW